MEKEGIGVPSPIAPSQSRKLSSTQLVGSGRSKSSLNSTAPRQTSDDIRRRKRVKFAEIGASNSLGFKPDASPNPKHGIATPSYDDAKTSEYKSYKKLIEEACANFHSHQRPNQASHLKNSEATNSMKEMKNKVPSKCTMSRQQLPIEQVTPLDQLKSSPPIGVMNNPEANYNGMQCCHEGSFSEKRQGVLKLAAETFNLQVDDFVSKGCDLIPEFLQRLGLGSKKNHSDELRQPVHRNQLLDYPDSEIHIKSLTDTLRRDSTLTTAIQCGGKNFLQHSCDEAFDMIPSFQENVDDQLISAQHAHRAGTDYTKMTAWLMDFGRMDLLPQKKSDYNFDQIADFACNGYPASDALHSEFEHLHHEHYPCHCHLTEQPSVHYEVVPQGDSTEQSLVPYNQSSFIDFDELYIPDEPSGIARKKCTLQLLGWEKNDMIDADSSVGSEIIVGKETDQLPLTYFVPQPLGLEDYGPVESHAGTSVLNFSPGNSFRMFLGKIHSSLDAALVPSRSKFMLDWRSLSTDFFREYHPPTIPDLDMQELKAGGAYLCPYDGNRPGYFANDGYGIHNFSTDHSEILLGRHDGVCSVMPDSWYKSEKEKIW